MSYDDLQYFDVVRASDVIEKAIQISNPFGGGGSSEKKRTAKKNSPQRPLVTRGDQFLKMISREKGQNNGKQT